MKKIIIVILSLFLFYVHTFTVGIQVTNIASYSIREGPESYSNSVITDVKYGSMDFIEDNENEKLQNLTEENMIFLKGILKMSTSSSIEMSLRASFTKGVFARSIKFTVIDSLTNEVVELENNSENSLESVNFIFKGNRNYLIFAQYKDLKNTINLESALFSLDLVTKEDNAVLGSISNTLLINNYLKLSEHEENEKEQEFLKDKPIKVIGNLRFDNILNEKIVLKVNLEKDVQFENIELRVDGVKVEIFYNSISKKYETKEIIHKGISKVELILQNPKYIGDIDSGKLGIEVNYENGKYGEIQNNIKYKKDQNILIEKISQTKIASIGDLVKYEVVIKNSLNEKFEELIYTDYLPRGMAFIENSVKIPENFILEDVKINNGNKIDIKLKAKNTSRSIEDEKITYLVRVNSSAKDGKNINRVNVIGKNTLGQTFGSNIATAEVKIDTDNFYDKGIVLGRVFLDIDGDNLFNEDVDINIPGVKIFLENGDFAISDRHGKYSIYGVEALTHIAKV
ncbi:MAG: hypothetical protein ACRDDH_18345, partial [Cetobacterium sp.]|uniref:hypothetical protein n=1 Tax=Cetobacterium sp. TaxID=2071632 RepID=UPI003EE507AC